MSYTAKLQQNNAFYTIYVHCNTKAVRHTELYCAESRNTVNDESSTALGLSLLCY